MGGIVQGMFGSLLPLGRIVLIYRNEWRHKVELNHEFRTRCSCSFREGGKSDQSGVKSINQKTRSEKQERKIKSCVLHLCMMSLTLCGIFGLQPDILLQAIKIHVLLLKSQKM